MKTQSKKMLEILMHKGVSIPNPESVEIADDVDLNKIFAGTTIHTGCRISGEKTLILSGAGLGKEAPVSVENCQIGPGVELRGGYFKESVFLSKAVVGSGAHVRKGTIMEEEASVAHTVGLKQTILFPFVTLGSLVNFCDCLMSGGTDRKNHSEVGSSYIHFNYTPNQDKATPSLLGDVPQGVMLDQNPIFLGGQGGLVGPCRLAFGSAVAAGTIYRKDELRPGRMLFGRETKSGSVPFEAGIYQSIRRVVVNNLVYIGNLLALGQWYRLVRAQFVSDDFPQVLLAGLCEKADMAFAERLNRLQQLSEKMPFSIERYRKAAPQKGAGSLVQQKQELFERWPILKNSLSKLLKYEGDIELRDAFLESIQRGVRSSGNVYIDVIKRLPEMDKISATRWLQGIIDHVVGESLRMIPSFEANTSREDGNG
ncbi:protein GlmU [Thermodesulfobacteriota bacterium]